MIFKKNNFPRVPYFLSLPSADTVTAIVEASKIHTTIFSELPTTKQKNLRH